MLKILPFASYREGFVGSLFLTCRVITRHNLRNQSMAGKNAENAEKIVPAELDHGNSKMREQNNKMTEELMEQKNVGLFVIYIKRWHFFIFLGI